MSLYLTQRQRETIQEARSAIRDMAYGWPVKELCATPEEIVERLTYLLGDVYDFESGNGEALGPPKVSK